MAKASEREKEEKESSLSVTRFRVIKKHRAERRWKWTEYKKKSKEKPENNWTRSVCSRWYAQAPSTRSRSRSPISPSSIVYIYYSFILTGSNGMISCRRRRWLLWDRELYTYTLLCAPCARGVRIKEKMYKNKRTVLLVGERVNARDRVSTMN